MSAPWPIPDDEVRAALEAAWADGSWGRYHGPHTDRLCQELARRHAVEFVTLCCSGTLAVELALRGLKIGAGDEVILSGYDFPGNFRAIEAVGARPVLVDVSPRGCLIDLDALEAAIGPDTRAVIVSHLHSELVDMPRVMEIARRHRLAVVEDACQATGARVAGRTAGTWGAVGVLSFGGSKLLTAGRGGALLTASDEIHQRVRIHCHRGNDAFPLSELQAAVLVPQLEKLDARNERRRASVARLVEQTTEVRGLKPIVEQTEGWQASYYKMAWRYEAEDLTGATVDQVVAALVAAGVPTDRGFRGFAGRGPTRCRKAGPLPHSRRAADTTLVLHHPVLLEPEPRIDALAEAIRQVASALRNGGGA